MGVCMYVLGGGGEFNYELYTVESQQKILRILRFRLLLGMQAN